MHRDRVTVLALIGVSPAALAAGMAINSGLTPPRFEREDPKLRAWQFFPKEMAEAYNESLRIKMEKRHGQHKPVTH